MAIPIPQFNVALLSPQSIIQQRQPFLPGVLETMMNIQGQRRLAEEAFGRQKEMEVYRRQLDLEDDFTRSVMGGELISPTSAGIAPLPGESIPTVQGIGPYSGQPFVKAADVAAVRQQRYLNQPVESIYGRQAIPGTTRGQTLDRYGQPREERDITGLQMGDAEGVQDYINTLVPEGTERDMLAAQFESALRSGGVFTAAEEQALMDPNRLDLFRTYYNTKFEQDAASRDAAGKVVTSMREYATSWEYADETGHHPLGWRENVALGYITTGNGDLLLEQGMSEQELADMEALLFSGKVRRKADPFDNRNSIVDIYTNAVTPGSPTSYDLANWIEARYQSARAAGDPAAEQIAAMMTQAGYSPADKTNFLRFASSPAARPIAQLYALRGSGYFFAKDIARYANQFSLPFGLHGVWAMGPIMYGDLWNPEGFPAPIAGGMPSLSAEEHEDNTLWANDIYDRMTQMFGAGTQITRQEIAGVFDPTTSYNDPDKIRSNLRTIASDLREGGTAQELLLAEFLETIIRMGDDYKLRALGQRFLR